MVIVVRLQVIIEKKCIMEHKLFKLVVERFCGTVWVLLRLCKQGLAALSRQWKQMKSCVRACV